MGITVKYAESTKRMMQMEYANHTMQDISSYDDYLQERSEELYFSYWSILKWKMTTYKFIPDAGQNENNSVENLGERGIYVYK